MASTRRCSALLHIARTVRRDPLALTSADVQSALDAGATDGDVQLAVLIAAGFSMYNRMVDGLRARTAPVTDVYARPRRRDRRERLLGAVCHPEPSSGVGDDPRLTSGARPGRPYPARVSATPG